MLAAKSSLGLDGCPVGFGKFVEHTSHYNLLNIPVTRHAELYVIVVMAMNSPRFTKEKRIKQNILIKSLGIMSN